LIKNPQLRQRLGEAGRKKILEKYHLKNNVGLLSDIFRTRLKS
jgi:glycosyltransferase involved in cell wall biosynthesis